MPRPGKKRHKTSKEQVDIRSTPNKRTVEQVKNSWQDQSTGTSTRGLGVRGNIYRETDARLGFERL